jgi:hypothetical protein
MKQLIIQEWSGIETNPTPTIDQDPTGNYLVFQDQHQPAMRTKELFNMGWISSIGVVTGVAFTEIAHQH